MNQDERKQAVVKNIVDVCAFVIATAEPSVSKHLKEVLADENRSIFVALALRIALGNQPQRVEMQLEMTNTELQDALNPKRHWVEEKEFVELVNAAVEMKLAKHASAVKSYTTGLKKLAEDKQRKSMRF